MVSALAARMCAGCPVQRECLELELRIAGAETTGVWGGLCEVDRRALHTVWRARRVLLAAAVIAGIQWLVIHYLASNTTLVWVALGVPALLAGYTLADGLTGSIGLGSSLRKRRGGGRR